MKNIHIEKVAIVGIGLIGGSIAMAMRKHLGSKVTILGLSSTSKKAQIAHKHNIIDRALTSLKDIPQDIDLVVLSTPIVTNIKLLKSLKKLTTSKQIIIDVGSTKEMICREAVKLDLRNFIGTHPMAGNETSGLGNADPDLFQNKPWIICPDSQTDKSKITFLKNFITSLGAKPFILNSKAHDRIAALSSHIFLIMSSILVNATSKNNWDKISQIASTGFKDTTRLASHSPNMKKEIILTNKMNIQKALKSLSAEIELFSSLLKDDEENKIMNYFQQAKSVRDDWLNKYSINT
ncbi:hypothetical protein A2773_00915 [Candidatus Gottesmanbacteria bacterium RIFCSPHIGHO2_01_FULL_39_10]|uniref:Prephenate/arogenate dehydrogenase domain-containing protein n=1 Tax=Candidatus Gottesmanbacteria bacterium RIFCSPHIGHO2_01_FULL_39_10 TaxID=1798375 RepID=A0A1F5ZLJ2_9BACT|nr:MAG: hypothetical protein A2773_00915 [Candidatus Gottesmanbacteria bacterium RIFCSPHIGHO2_01_FULL_39_10]